MLINVFKKTGMAFSILFIFFTAAWSVDRYAPSTNYPTVQQAIDASQVGDCVFICDIIYQSFNVTVDGIRIEAINDAKIYLPNYTPIVVSKNWITLKNLKINTYQGNALKLATGIQDFFADNCHFKGVVGQSNWAIDDWGVSTADFSSCHFEGFNTGIDSYNATDLTFTSCYMVENVKKDYDWYGTTSSVTWLSLLNQTHAYSYDGNHCVDAYWPNSSNGYNNHYLTTNLAVFTQYGSSGYPLNLDGKVTAYVSDTHFLVCSSVGWQTSNGAFVMEANAMFYPDCQHP